MALEQRLSVRMSQRLIMTPSLQQAIKLLQMSKLELVEEIQQELTENPVLEEALEEGPAAERAESETAPAEVPETPESADAEPSNPFEDIDYESLLPRRRGLVRAARTDRDRRDAPVVREHARREARPCGTPDLAARHECLDRPREGNRQGDHRQPERGRLPHGQRGGASGDGRLLPPTRSAPPWIWFKASIPWASPRAISWSA